MRRRTKKNNKSMRSARRLITGGAQETIICVVHATWCGHCKNLMLEPDETGKTKWQQVKEKLDGKCVVNDYEETNNKDDIEKLKTEKGLTVDGYPTIFKIINGKIEKFEQPAEVDNIVNWALDEKIGGKKRRQRNTIKKTSKKTWKFW